MPLTKKQMRYYKPLVFSRLEEMGLKDEIGYTKTGFKKKGLGQTKQEDGTIKFEMKDMDTYRATNILKSMMKKILKLDAEGVQRFLDTTEPQPEENQETGVAEGSDG